MSKKKIIIKSKIMALKSSPKETSSNLSHLTKIKLGTELLVINILTT